MREVPDLSFVAAAPVLGPDRSAAASERPSRRSEGRVLLPAMFCCVYFVGATGLPGKAIGFPIEETAASRFDPELYAGTWIRIESQADRAALRESIDRAADGLPLLMRGLARRVMHSRIGPRERYEIAAAEDHESIRIGLVVLQLDAESHEFTGDDGKTVVRTSQLSNGAIVTHWQRGDSQGTSLYRISVEGRTLVVEVTIQPDRFPTPIAYKATYRRVCSEDGHAAATVQR